MNRKEDCSQWNTQYGFEYLSKQPTMLTKKHSGLFVSSVHFIFFNLDGFLNFFVILLNENLYLERKNEPNKLFAFIYHLFIFSA